MVTSTSLGRMRSLVIAGVVREPPLGRLDDAGEGVGWRPLGEVRCRTDLVLEQTTRERQPDQHEIGKCGDLASRQG